MIKQSSTNSLFLSSIIAASLLLFAPAILHKAGKGTSQDYPRPNSGDAMAAPVHKKGNLKLELSFTSGETSKDSHEYVYSCRISDSRMIYSGPYGECERGQCPHRKMEFDLTPGDEAALIKKAELSGLFKNFKETRPINDIGTWSRVSLSIAAGERAGDIRIEGMVNNWSRRGVASAVLSGGAKEKLDSVDSLRSAITAIARKHFSGYH